LTSKKFALHELKLPAAPPFNMGMATIRSIWSRLTAYRCRRTYTGRRISHGVVRVEVYHDLRVSYRNSFDENPIESVRNGIKAFFEPTQR
jgi:hypothetical protein